MDEMYLSMFSENQKLSIMSVLLEIIYGDGKVDYREVSFFNTLSKELGFGDDAIDKKNRKSVLLSLLDIKSFTTEQKKQLAMLMDKTIKIDEDININEVVIYEVVISFCHIDIPFQS